MSKTMNENKLLQQEKQYEEQQKTKPKSYYWFELILYPQDNETNNNQELMQWLMDTPYICKRYVYILHDRDMEDGKTKKPHIHFLAEFTEKYTKKGLIKMLVDLTEVQVNPIQHLRGAMLYLTHETREAIRAGKTKYDISELKGNTALINERIIQNGNYIQETIEDIVHNNIWTWDCLQEMRTYSEATKNAMRAEFYKHSCMYQKMLSEERYRQSTQYKHYTMDNFGNKLYESTDEYENRKTDIMLNAVRQDELNDENEKK